jgi:hypothetical protein
VLLYFALEYVTKKVQENQGLELNGTHPILVCTDDVYTLAENKHNKKKEALLQARRGVCLEVNKRRQSIRLCLFTEI